MLNIRLRLLALALVRVELVKPEAVLIAGNGLAVELVDGGLDAIVARWRSRHGCTRARDPLLLRPASASAPPEEEEDDGRKDQH